MVAQRRGHQKPGSEGKETDTKWNLPQKLQNGGGQRQGLGGCRSEMDPNEASELSAQLLTQAHGVIIRQF